jgi:hypothetical protein
MNIDAMQIVAHVRFQRAKIFGSDGVEFDVKCLYVGFMDWDQTTGKMIV